KINHKKTSILLRQFTLFMSLKVLVASTKLRDGFEPLFYYIFSKDKSQKNPQVSLKVLEASSGFEPE
ncbi:hypothetical protein DNC80_14800, partial [Flavobacterium sp. SOK18b]|nr:hypothetical protein [Flavobacterium sp. SOK18b]